MGILYLSYILYLITIFILTTPKIQSTTISAGVEPTIFCLGGRRVSIALRDQHKIERINKKKDRNKNKAKAPAGIEPTTFPLLGERTADYAKRPNNKEEKRKKK